MRTGWGSDEATKRRRGWKKARRHGVVQEGEREEGEDERRSDEATEGMEEGTKARRHEGTEVGRRD
jgi:hypothetical protein